MLPGLLTIGNMALSAAARRYRLDLVHDPNGVAPFLGPAQDARRVVTIHDALPYVYPASHNQLDTWRYRWLLPITARKADYVLTVSECSRRDLQHYLQLRPDRIGVTGEGVDERFTPVPASPTRAAVLERYGITPPYLLYVGGITARKNIVRLFEAYAQVRALRPDVQLVIGGKRQWQTDGIDATLQQLNLGGNIHFTGYVHDDDLPSLYSGAELFVFPSLYEGFGLPPIEAMACGTPVVTAHTSSLPEVVGDAALTVDPTSVQALADAILRVLTDNELREILRARGKARASQWTWANTASRTLHAYQRVLAQRLLTPA
jgi:glycosyltransferase involved in cell wall biosynthesis